MSTSGLSLDIGEKYLKIADGEIVKEKYNAKALAFCENPVNVYSSPNLKAYDQTSSLLQKLVKDAGIKKKNVNIIIPDSHSYSQILEMPILTEKELISAIKYQADQFIPLPIEKITLDLQVLSEDKKNRKMRILIVAAENSVIDTVTKIVEKSGLLPDSVENELSASLRFFSSFKSGKNPSSPYPLFVNVGFSTTSLFLYDFSANLPLEIHNFSLGVEIFVKELQANFNLDQKQSYQILEKIGFSDQQNSYNFSEILTATLKEYVSELDRFLISVKNKFNLIVEDIFLFGEGFNINSFDKKISNLLGKEVNSLDIFQYLENNKVIESVKNDLPLFVASIGGNVR